jgi:bifunctional UDP-N-acetylglucosamine pyrophosphorylase/glucosamine-1-phosphate N-acetyltransferase
VLAADARLLFDLLSKVKNANAKGEYYLTDVVALARARGLRCAVARADEAELMGVNSRVELAQAEAVIQARLRRAAMESGVSMADPASVHLSWDTALGRDVTLGPHVVFGPGVRVADDVEIRAYCHLEGARIASGAVIGPFARLRPGAVVSKGAHVGNFVEMKQAILGPGAKANHLTYLGDASVGAGANVGAGTITCNYDGYLKSRTEIGAGAFIGSNTALVAPVKIGRGAIVGAGSVISKDVPADALAVERAEQRMVKGYARAYRARKAAEKARNKKGG